MTRYTPELSADDVERLSRVVTVGSLRGEEIVKWFGHRLGPLGSDEVVEELADVIYSNAYVLGSPQPIAGGSVEADTGEGSPMELPDVRHSLAARDGAWEVTRQDAEWNRLEKAGSPPMYVRTVFVQIEPDGLNSLPVPSYSERRLPGWVTLAHGAMSGSEDITRFYLNTDRARASAAADEIARGLLAIRVPAFLMKWLSSAYHDSRADSMVLYVPSDSSETVATMLDELELGLNDARVPMFTEVLAPGRARAKDPGGPDSYGQVASREAARRIIVSLRADPRRRWKPESRHPSELADEPREQQTQNPQAALAHLEAFAAQLARDAIWDGDRAGWLTRDSIDGTITSAGADVYSGAVGPVLALAHVARATNSCSVVPLMRAAARQVVQRLDELGHGFHSGAAGTAAVLAEAALISRDDVLRDLAAEALDGATTAARGSTSGWDVISGLAGTALGLASASALLGVDAPEELSRVLDDLVAAESDGRGWTTPIGRGRRMLDGMAHGRWGAILAVDVASRTLTDDRHEPVLMQSIERAIVRSRQHHGRSVDRRYDGYRETTSWCHGSAGVTLAALALRDRIPACDPIIDAAIAQSIEWSTTVATPSGGLCHGVIGVVLSARAAGRRTALAAHMIAPITNAARGSSDLSLMTGASGFAIGQYVAALDLATPVALSLRPHSPRDEECAI